MLDNPEYALRAHEKMCDYQDSGFIQGIDIIYTFETSIRPLNRSVIYRIIENYFLEILE